MKSYEEYYMEIMDSIFKQKGVSIWAIVIIVLLIVNGIFFYGLVTVSYSYAGGVAVAALTPIGLLLSIITFIVVFTYVIKQHPHGIFKVISYTVLIVISLMLAFLGIGIILIITSNLN